MLPTFESLDRLHAGSDRVVEATELNERSGHVGQTNEDVLALRTVLLFKKRRYSCIILRKASPSFWQRYLQKLDFVDASLVLPSRKVFISELTPEDSFGLLETIVQALDGRIQVSTFEHVFLILKIYDATACAADVVPAA